MGLVRRFVLTPFAAALLGAVVLPAGVVLPAAAQAPVQRDAPPSPPATDPHAAAPDFDSVLTTASSQSSFTFDRSMLQAADGFLANGDAETRRVVAGLTSITVRNYRARDFARYDPSALSFIDGQLRAAGWKHLVNANAKDASRITDLWLHFQGADITNVAVLTRGDRNMSVVQVSCDLRPLDLVHLSGHFGIPKVDENAVMVPAH